MRLLLSNLKTVIRLASLLLLLVASMGPWFADSHPATEQTCADPLVWLGDGHCACLISILAYVGAIIAGQNLMWFLVLPPALPFLSTLFLLLIGDRCWLWVCHLTAWGLAAIHALFFFLANWISYRELFLWGAGLGSLAAVATLVWELRLARRQD